MSAKSHSKVGNTLVRLILQNGEPGDLPMPKPEDAWDEVESVWGYSAIDAADEWWVRWGRLRQHAKEIARPDPSRDSRFVVRDI